MINTGPLRAAAAVADGDVVGVSKADLAQLLDEVDAGQKARRELWMIAAVAGDAGIAGVSGLAG